MSDQARQNRSDVVRHRRREEATKRLQDSAVLSRHPMTATTARAVPVGRGRSGSAHRRGREVSLSMSGVQVHMPTISFSGGAAKWRFVSFGVSLALGAGLYLAATSPFFRVAAPQVSGNERVPAAEIEAVMASTGTQVFGLVPSDLERRIRQNFPELLDARISVRLPGMVDVEVRERRPVIAWNQGGAYTWIDETGVAFRPRGAAAEAVAVQAQEAPVPVNLAHSDPLSPAPFIPADLVRAIQELAPHAPSGATMIYDTHHGLGWIDNRGWQVFFGDEPRDMSLKLRVYESMVQMVTSKGIRPALISVRYPGAPYYRMAQ